MTNKYIQGTILILTLLFQTILLGQTVTVSTFAGTGIGSLDGPSNIGMAIPSFNSPYGIAIDPLGTMYVADENNYKIRKITSNGVVTTFAGSGVYGSADGQGLNASFAGPAGLALDATGNLYVVDRTNHKIRKITPAGIVTTIAGSGVQGNADGTGTAASFKYPTGIAVDASGTLYVSDRDNHKIRKISPNGVVSTFAGNGTAGVLDGAGTAARFSTPTGMAIDASGILYVADLGSNRIRKITSTGTVSTFAGNVEGNADGIGTAAKFSEPVGLALDASGNVYVVDRNNYQIRKITSTGVVSTLAGAGTPGSKDGTGTTASFKYPHGIALDAFGNAYVTDASGCKIRKITSSGVVSTFVGTGSLGNIDGTGIAASFDSPTGVALDALGNSYVTDRDNHKIRKVSANGIVSTFAGSGVAGNVDGTGVNASFNKPAGIAIDNLDNLYVVEESGHKIRKITPEGIVNTIAGSGFAGSSDGQGLSSSFNSPRGIALDELGNLYVADVGNNKIRKITPEGIVSTLAGSGVIGNVDGSAPTASFNGPNGLAVDGTGNVYVADRGNNKIRKITSEGIVSTFAGTGSSGDVEGMGNVASFKWPMGVALDVSGNLYVADRNNNKIRKITPEGVVSTLAGDGTTGSTDGEGQVASFSIPYSVALDASGMIYVADVGNNKIRKITPSVVAGTTGSLDQTSLVIHPNPSREEIKIDLEGEKHLVLVGMSGQIYLDEIISSQSIEVGSLPKGIYVLKVEQNNKVYRNKLVIE